MVKIQNPEAPVELAIPMQIDVHLRRNCDGLTRVYRDTTPYPESWEYLWQDGNYACDCNRALFFARAGREEDPASRPCGMTAFTVSRAVNVETGAVIYTEDDDSQYAGV